MHLLLHLQYKKLDVPSSSVTGSLAELAFRDDLNIPPTNPNHKMTNNIFVRV